MNDSSKQLSELLNKIQKIIERNPSMDKATTKTKIIRPLLESLGWDFLSDDVRLEYPVKMRRGTQRVDYAFLVKGSPVNFVEAKAIGSDINERDARHIISYGRVEKVRCVAVTNGKEIKIFDSEFRNKPEECLVDKITLSEFKSKQRKLELL